MAQLPCAITRHRFRGKSAHAYLGVVDGVTQQRRSIRLCPHHMDELLAQVLRWKLADDALEYPERNMCASCERGLQNPPSNSVALFGTAYRGNSDQVEWYALNHRDCRLPPWAQVMLDNATGGADYGSEST